MIYRLIIFLVLNFSALGIGSMFTSSGVTSIWYQNLEKAPWTPPGWVFGAAWFTIMICFAVYMSFAWVKIANPKLLISLFTIQWILNILWNPVFFKFHDMLAGLFVITTLTILVGYFLFAFFSQLKSKSILILPYFLWLLVATSLNAYIYFKN
jgi:translocator protein